MREKEILKMLFRFVVWVVGILMVLFMEFRKESRFGVEDREFNYRYVEFEMFGFI